MVCVTDASFCRLPVPWVWPTPSESQVVIFDGREEKEEENKGNLQEQEEAKVGNLVRIRSHFCHGAGVKGEDAQFTERDNHQFKVVKQPKQNSDWMHLVPTIGHKCRRNDLATVNLS